MSERCDRCGAMFALVGIVHRCIPTPFTMTVHRVEPKCTAHPDKPVKTKNPSKPKAKPPKKKGK